MGAWPYPPWLVSCNKRSVFIPEWTTPQLCSMCLTLSPMVSLMYRAKCIHPRVNNSPKFMVVCYSVVWYCMVGDGMVWVLTIDGCSLQMGAKHTHGLGALFLGSLYQELSKNIAYYAWSIVDQILSGENWPLGVGGPYAYCKSCPIPSLQFSVFRCASISRNYSGKGSHPLPNRMFFYTLCKRSLPPPPSFYTIMLRIFRHKC